MSEMTTTQEGFNALLLDGHARWFKGDSGTYYDPFRALAPPIPIPPRQTP